MYRRRLNRWTAWLLPLLIARLFVPAGFMLSMSDAGLSVILCSGVAALPAPGAGHVPHADHAGMDYSAPLARGNAHAQHGEPGSEQLGSEHKSHENSLCPFAVTAGGASCPADKALGELPRLADVVPNFHADPVWLSPAVLIDRIRGPPLV